MIRARDLTPSLMALFGAAGLGGIALLLTLMPSLAIPFSPEPELSSRVTIEKTPALNVPPLETYVVIADRPLFNAGRVKDTEAPAQPAVELAPLSDYRLAGLVVSGETQRAIVERVSGEAVTLKPGDTLDGRTVTKIGPRGVVLAAEGHEEILTFPRAGRARARGVAMTGGSAQANR